MNKWIKTLLFIIALGTTAALAGAIKTWSSGEVLTASDLNTVLQHIHNSMVGGHGARLVNADVASSAGIAHSKLATPALVPKGWVYVAAVCNPGVGMPCAGSITAAGKLMSTVIQTATGKYQVNFSPALANTNYVLSITPETNVPVYCFGISHAANGSSAVIECMGGNPPVDTNAAFSVMLYDDDN